MSKHEELKHAPVAPAPKEPVKPTPAPEVVAKPAHTGKAKKYLIRADAFIQGVYVRAGEVITVVDDGAPSSKPGKHWEELDERTARQIEEDAVRASVAPKAAGSSLNQNSETI